MMSVCCDCVEVRVVVSWQTACAAVTTAKPESSCFSVPITKELKLPNMTHSSVERVNCHWQRLVG